MNAGLDRWLRNALGAALIAGLCATVHAGEAVAPDAEEKAKKLLEQEAANQAKLRAEVKAEVDAHYEAGKRLWENFDYEGAKKELEYALRLNRDDARVRSLLNQVRDKFDS